MQSDCTPISMKEPLLTKDGKKFHSFDAKYYSCNCLLNRLQNEKEEEYLLIASVIENSAMFTHQAIRWKIRASEYPRLAELILKIKPQAFMTIQQLTGICFALIALNEKTLERLPVFLKQLPADVPLTVIEKLRGPAMTVMRAKEVREHLFKNY